MKDVRRVVIATPVYADVAPEFTQSLIESLALLRERRYLATWIYEARSIVDRSRNLLVAQQLAAKADVLVQIDADTAWPAPDLVAGVEAVLSGMVDVLGYPVPNRRPGVGAPDLTSPYLLPDRPVRGFTVSGMRFVEVASVGGIIIASRAAVLRLSENVVRDGRGIPEIFSFERVEGIRLGEDVYFCRRWRDLGGKVHCLIDSTITHFGRVAYQGDFSASMLTGVPLDLEERDPR